MWEVLKGTQQSSPACPRLSHQLGANYYYAPFLKEEGEKISGPVWVATSRGRCCYRSFPKTQLIANSIDNEPN